MDTPLYDVTHHIRREHHLSRILPSMTVHRSHPRDQWCTLMARYHPTHARIYHRCDTLCHSQLYSRITLAGEKSEHNTYRLQEAPPLNDTYKHTRTRTLRSWQDAISEVDHSNSGHTQSPLLSPHDSSRVLLPRCCPRARRKSILSPHRPHPLVWI